MVRNPYKEEHKDDADQQYTSQSDITEIPDYLCCILSFMWVAHSGYYGT